MRQITGTRPHTRDLRNVVRPDVMISVMCAGHPAAKGIAAMAEIDASIWRLHDPTRLETAVAERRLARRGKFLP